VLCHFPLFQKIWFSPSVYQEMRIYSLSNRNMERLICGEELRLVAISADIVLYFAFSRNFHLSFCFPVDDDDSCGLKSCHTPLSVTHRELSEISARLIFSQSQSCQPTHGIMMVICTFLSFLGLFGKRVPQSVPVFQFPVCSFYLHKTLCLSSERTISPSVVPRLQFLKIKVAVIRCLCTLLSGTSVKITQTTAWRGQGTDVCPQF